MCASRLPISRSTLVYGSDDQGRTVAAGDARLNAVMRKTCERLHLAPHNAGPLGARGMFYGPVDLEVHCVRYAGGGRRYYVAGACCP